MCFWTVFGIKSSVYVIGSFLFACFCFSMRSLLLFSSKYLLLSPNEIEYTRYIVCSIFYVCFFFTFGCGFSLHDVIVVFGDGPPSSNMNIHYYHFHCVTWFIFFPWKIQRCVCTDKTTKWITIKWYQIIGFFIKIMQTWVNR